jgi:hypothetical protein
LLAEREQCFSSAARPLLTGALSSFARQSQVVKCGDTNNDDREREVLCFGGPQLIPNTSAVVAGKGSRPLATHTPTRYRSEQADQLKGLSGLYRFTAAPHRA